MQVTLPAIGQNVYYNNFKANILSLQIVHFLLLTILNILVSFLTMRMRA